MKGSHNKFLSLKGFEIAVSEIPTAPKITRVNAEVNWTITERTDVEGTEKAHKGAI